MQICPRCRDASLSHTPSRNAFPAISRRDNKTEICAGCGIQEALEDSRLVPEWSRHDYWDVNSPVWLAQCAKPEFDMPPLKDMLPEENGNA